MAEQFRIVHEHPVARRALAVVTSVAINSVISAALLATFHSSSALPWLAPTAANAVMLSRCEKNVGTASRRECIEQIVANATAREGAVQLAKNTALPAR